MSHSADRYGPQNAFWKEWRATCRGIEEKLRLLGVVTIPLTTNFDSIAENERLRTYKKH